jgi:hypothetical protein
MPCVSAMTFTVPGLGTLGALPSDLLSRELLPRISQHDLARVAETSRALRNLTRPLLSRALRCSYCRTYLLHPRELDAARAGNPTLFVVQTNVRPPSLLSANARYYCAECRCRVGKLVVVHGGAQLVALEIGPVRLVNSEGKVVGLLDGLAVEPLVMLCRGPGCNNGVLGDAREDLLYRTEREGVQYFCCYALQGTTCSEQRRRSIDKQWGEVETAKVTCSVCGFAVGFKFCGRICPDDSAMLDDRGDVRFTLVRCDAVQETPELSAFFP